MRKILFIMTLILPLLISNGSWGSDLPECEGSPLDIVNSADEKSFQILMLSDWNDCQGKLTYDGVLYFGEFKDGLFHGQGTETWGVGNQYVGEYKDGYKNGQGTFTTSIGSKYIGEFKDGLMHGQGTYTNLFGTKMEGIWKENEFLYENTLIEEDEESCQEIGFKVDASEYDNCVQKSAEKE